MRLTINGKSRVSRFPNVTSPSDTCGEGKRDSETGPPTVGSKPVAALISAMTESRAASAETR